MSAQYQLNVCPCLPNICPMSAQCPQFPLNVPYVCLMFLISAQCPICLPNVLNFYPMSFAVKSRISSDMFFLNIRTGRIGFDHLPCLNFKSTVWTVNITVFCTHQLPHNVKKVPNNAKYLASLTVYLTLYFIKM